MPSIKTLMQTRTDQLDQTLDELKALVDEGDFEHMAAAADKLSEQADQLTAKLEQVANAAADDEEANQDDDQPKSKKTKQPVF